MKKMIILLAALVMSAMPAAVQCNQNNCVELNRDIEFGKNSILFDGQQATIEDLMNNNPQFGEVELWYDNWGMQSLGTVGSPKWTSLFNDTARFYTLAKQQPGKPHIVWSEEQNALILLEGWNSGYAQEACNKLAQHKAMLDQFIKKYEHKYEKIEREYQKIVQ